MLPQQVHWRAAAPSGHLPAPGHHLRCTALHRCTNRGEDDIWKLTPRFAGSRAVLGACQRRPADRPLFSQRPVVSPRIRGEGSHSRALYSQSGGVPCPSTRYRRSCRLPPRRPLPPRSRSCRPCPASSCSGPVPASWPRHGPLSLLRSYSSGSGSPTAGPRLALG